MTKIFKTLLFTLLCIFYFSLNNCVFSVDVNYLIKPRIHSVIDGDTIKIWTRERPVSVRLTGIDCYETSQNGHIHYQRNQGLSDEEIIEKGLKAKEELLKILRSHKIIYLELTGIDKKWGRLVGEFYFKDTNGHYTSINNEMQYTDYCKQYVFKPYTH